MKTLYNLRNIMTLLFMVMLMNGVIATKWTVQVSNFSFTPATLNSVTVGDTVRWVWVSGAHTTTSSSIPAGAAAWDEMISSSNTEYEYKVTIAGTYNYVCTPHIGMGMVGSFMASGVSPTLTVTPQNQNVGAASGATSFNVVSNSIWDVSSNSSWCSVTPSGTGNGTIGADYETNASVSPRTATITVTVTGLPAQMVTVTQAGASAVLSVSPPEQNVTNSAGSTSFSVTSNTIWSASSNSSWCTVTPSGTGNGTLIAEYSENSSATERSAIITITVTDLSPVTVTVNQDGGSVSIGNNELKTISVVPNPSSGLFKVSVTGSSDKITNLTLLDITGKKIEMNNYSGTKTVELDLLNQPEGIYFLEIKTNESHSIRKLVIDK